jgi:mannose-P-dolichol utilization defect protein 1
MDFSKTEMIMPCIEFSALKGVSFAIIAGAFIFKIPQVMKIINSGSVEGISAVSYYTENMTFINTSAYSIHLALPFMVFGESLVILVQNLGITILIWTMDKKIGIMEKIMYLVFTSGYMFVLFNDTLLSE